MDEESQYVYRVTAKDKNTGEWVPVAGGLRDRKLRIYEKLGTAKGVRTQWATDQYAARFYSEFRIERMPVTWEVIDA